MDLRQLRRVDGRAAGLTGTLRPSGPCAAGMELEERRRLTAVPTLFDTLHDAEEEGDDAA